MHDREPARFAEHAEGGEIVRVKRDAAERGADCRDESAAGGGVRVDTDVEVDRFGAGRQLQVPTERGQQQRPRQRDDQRVQQRAQRRDIAIVAQFADAAAAAF